MMTTKDWKCGGISLKSQNHHWPKAKLFGKIIYLNTAYSGTKLTGPKDAWKILFL